MCKDVVYGRVRPISEPVRTSATVVASASVKQELLFHVLATGGEPATSKHASPPNGRCVSYPGVMLKTMMHQHQHTLLACSESHLPIKPPLDSSRIVCNFARKRQDIHKGIAAGSLSSIKLPVQASTFSPGAVSGLLEEEELPPKM